MGSLEMFLGAATYDESETRPTSYYWDLLFRSDSVSMSDETDDAFPADLTVLRRSQIYPKGHSFPRQDSLVGCHVYSEFEASKPFALELVTFPGFFSITT